MAKLSFNASKAEPMKERSFTLLPEGEYLFSLVKSDMVRNKKDTAFRLNFQAKVLGGESKGNIVFIGLNWDHPNPDAQAISDREFKSICDAVGKGDDEIENTEELHGIPFIGTIKHSAPSGEYKENGETKFKYGPKAEIKKYEEASEEAVAELQASTAEDEEESSSDKKSTKKVPWDE